ncbi:MAG: ABC transporter permease, partial [bacterium]|nr:ABC transporter permease [bacterium]
GQLQDVINGSAVLTVYDMNNPLQAGDTIQTTVAGKEQELQIAGVLSDCPFHREEGIETMICSEETFRRLTGENGYTILDIQLGRKATDADVTAIRKLAGDDVQFSDQRMSNSDVRGAYYSMSIFIYGFLIIIALISVFNIVNSIAMSVSARLGQYGAMRAIGMSDRQVIRMVGAEALTYSVSGIAIGCILGLPINKALFSSMITFRWGDAWQLPIGSMLVIILTVSAATILAIYGPAKQIREMTIVDTIRGE